MWFTPSSTARRSTASDVSRARMPPSDVDIRRMAPKPIRLTSKEPSFQVPAAAAGSVFVVMAPAFRRSPRDLRVWQFAATLEYVEKVTDVVMVRGEAELFERTAHLFAAATEISCAARDLHTWSVAHPSAPAREQSLHGLTVRKVYLPGVLFDPALADHLRAMAANGA